MRGLLILLTLLLTYPAAAQDTPTPTASITPIPGGWSSGEIAFITMSQIAQWNGIEGSVTLDFTIVADAPEVSGWTTLKTGDQSRGSEWLAPLQDGSLTATISFPTPRNPRLSFYVTATCAFTTPDRCEGALEIGIAARNQPNRVLVDQLPFAATPIGLEVTAEATSEPTPTFTPTSKANPLPAKTLNP